MGILSLTSHTHLLGCTSFSLLCKGGHLIGRFHGSEFHRSSSLWNVRLQAFAGLPTSFLKWLWRSHFNHITCGANAVKLGMQICYFRCFNFFFPLVKYVKHKIYACTWTGLSLIETSMCSNCKKVVQCQLFRFVFVLTVNSGLWNQGLMYLAPRVCS